jgi:acyl-CoA reductase-like NAD-dependent aldehyde dehydrogenase
VYAEVEATVRAGAWYPATALADTPPGSILMEEVSGPVAPLATFGSDDEAVALASATRCGLGASVWSRDAGRARALAGRIEAGTAFVNEEVSSDPARPLGGTKRSGSGREPGAAGRERASAGGGRSQPSATRWPWPPNSHSISWPLSLISHDGST